MTLTLTRTVSPGRNSGVGRKAASFLISSCSSDCSRFIFLSNLSASVTALAGQILLPKIGPALGGHPLCFRHPPAAGVFVLAREQHVGHGAALPILRPRVMGIFEKTSLEALLVQGRRIADNAGQQ